MLPAPAAPPTSASRAQDMPGVRFRRRWPPADLDGATAAAARARPRVYLRHRDDEVHDAAQQPPATSWSSGSSTSTGRRPAQLDLHRAPQHRRSPSSAPSCAASPRFMCFPQPGTGLTARPAARGGHAPPAVPELRHPPDAGRQLRDRRRRRAGPRRPTNERGGVALVRAAQARAGPWTLFQRGHVLARHHAALDGRASALDGAGNLAVGYNVASHARVFPGLRYAGRLAADPPGTLRAESDARRRARPPTSSNR